MTKEEIKKLHSEPKPKTAKGYLEKCARNVGSFKVLAKVTGFRAATILDWRKGRDVSARSAIKFEKNFNSHQERRLGSDKSMFRAKREKLLPWFFE